MNLLDLVIVALLLLGGLIGYRKGLINSIIGIAGSFIAFVVAFLTYKSFTPVLYEDLGLGRIFQRIIKDSMTSQVSTSQPIKGTGLDQMTLITNALPRDLQQEFEHMFVNMMNSAVGNTIKTIGDAIAHYFSLVIASVIAFLIIFALTKLALGMFGWALTRNLDRNMSGSINHSGGFLTGIVAALISVSIVMGFVTPVLKIYSEGNLAKLVEQSYLTPYTSEVFTRLTHLISQLIK